MPKTLSKPRSRVLNFRLTAEEFDSVVEACQRLGNSLSDFARTAVLECAAHAKGDGTLQHQISSLDRKLTDLDTTFSHLVENIESLNRIADARLACGSEDSET